MAEKEKSNRKAVIEDQYGRGRKLIGKDYVTPDLYAKVTGAAKYAEDYRAEGMLFCKLLLSPYPHARVKRIRAEKALRMPGVKAMVTAEEVPPPGDIIQETGVVKASKWTERALTNEPVYQGEPVLAIAAVDESTAVDAIENIEVDFEPLPFVTDPLDTLRPGGPNPRTDGNVWCQPAPPDQPYVTELKWTKEDFEEVDKGRLPMAKAMSEWSFGDVDAGLKNAALLLDETFLTPDTSHQPLETRTSMAYWQNGKVYIYCGTQSSMQTTAALGRWLRMDPKQIVFISEYTGGGFGSKITAGVTMIIPALLAKKTGTPVMMRISREEETYIGRGRSGMVARVKVGFSKQGRIVALDMFVITNNGPYEATIDVPISGRVASLLYQPEAMRFRGTIVLTNTPPRSSQRGPGGYQPITVMEPILSKAARKLGLDQVEIRRVNCPSGKAPFGPPVDGKLQHATSCFLKDALNLGAEKFGWSERVARTSSKSETKVRGVGVSISGYLSGTIGFDGLLVISPDGRVNFHTGIGNLGTLSMFDVHRVAAEILDIPWEKCDVTWGNSGKNFPFTSIQGGSQTTHAMTRAAHALAMATRRRLQEIAAKTLGGRPEDYHVAKERVFGKNGGPRLTLAEAAKRAIQLGGIYDGHQPPDDVHALTKDSTLALAGQGLVVAAKDNYPRDGATFSYLASFAEVEVDRETGRYEVIDYQAYVDVGTVIHPRSLGGQILGGSIMGIGHVLGQKWVFDPHYGEMVSRRFYQTKPPTILDVPVDMKWQALDIADPETPVGARGIGEPPVGAASAAILNALSDALGDEVFQRAPVNSDTILTSLEAGRPMQHPLTAHI